MRICRETIIDFVLRLQRFRAILGSIPARRSGLDGMAKPFGFDMLGGAV